MVTLRRGHLSFQGIWSLKHVKVISACSVLLLISIAQAQAWKTVPGYWVM